MHLRCDVEKRSQKGTRRAPTIHAAPTLARYVSRLVAVVREGRKEYGSSEIPAQAAPKAISRRHSCARQITIPTRLIIPHGQKRRQNVLGKVIHTGACSEKLPSRKRNE